MNRLYQFFFLILISLYALAPIIFEKEYYFNEILSLSGFIIFIINKGVVWYKRNSIYNLFFIFVFLCLFHLFYSMFIHDGWYVYLRNSVIFYSSFSFFVGYYLYNSRNLGRILFNKKLKSLIIFMSIFQLPINRVSFLTLLPLVTAKMSYVKQLSAIIILGIVVTFTYGGETSLAVSIFFTLLLFVRSFTAFIFVSFNLFFMILMLFIYLEPSLNLIIESDLFLFSDVIQSNRILSIDGNFTWRLILWYQAIISLFPINLIGIGFGTPMLEYFPIEDPENIHLLPYVLGAHNSFITLFARLGVAFVFLFFILYKVVFLEYFKHKKYYVSTNDVLYFHIFFIISVASFFNVVLESPIHSSLYWISLGFIAAAIYQRKLHFLSKEF